MEDKNKKVLENLIQRLEDGELEHDLKTWMNFDEREKQLLDKVKVINERRIERTRRYVLVGITFMIVLCGISFYFYSSYKPAVVAYSILPGDIREINIRYAKVWINGDTKVDTQSDSIVTLHDGEIFLSKSKDDQTLIVNTPFSSVKVISGNANILSRDNAERITALGNTMVTSNKKNTVLTYGQDLRIDSASYLVHTLQSTEYVGAFRFGKVAFENETLPFVLNQLSTFYRIKISYSILPNILVSMIVSKSEKPIDTIKKILPPEWTCALQPDGSYLVTPVNIGAN
jgi:ferric-dicitrate binding protein FerR (iron transport regulator)